MGMQNVGLRARLHWLTAERFVRATGTGQGNYEYLDKTQARIQSDELQEQLAQVLAQIAGG